MDGLDEFVAVVVAALIVSIGVFVVLIAPLVLAGFLGLLVVSALVLLPWVIRGAIEGYREAVADAGCDARDARRDERRRERG